MNQPLHPEALTWTALLSRWIEFAQASLALPRDAAGEAWRASVPHIINLQAVTFALADLGDLAPTEQPLALDKAEVLIRRARESLHQVWDASDMPLLVREVIADAQTALEVRSIG